MKKFKTFISFTLIISLAMALVVPTKAFADNIPWYVDDNFYNYYYRDGNGLLGNILKWSANIGGAELRPRSELWTGSGDASVYNSSTTNYYTPITVSNQDYYYDIYNPITNTYNTVNYTNLTYDPTYNSYYYDYTYNNYDYNTYVSYSDTYVTYNYICPEDPNQNKFFEIYFVLPDGRNSFNLTKDDLKGIVFSYDVDVYDVGQVGNTLGLWHLDGNFKNEIDGSIGSANSSTFKEGYFDGALEFNSTESYINLGNIELPDEYTLEFVAYFPSSITSSDYTIMVSSHNTGEVGSSSLNYNGNILPVTEYHFYKEISYCGVPSSSTGYHHISYVKDDNSINIYVDGNFVTILGDDPLDFVDNNLRFNAIYDRQLLFQNVGGYERWNSTSRYWSSTYPTSVLPFPLTGSSGIPSEVAFLQDNKWHNIDSAVQPVISRASVYLYDGYSNYSFNNCYIDEIRLSEGALYSDNYTPRNEPFDSGLGFVVPDNPIEQNIYMQSFVKPSVWQFGGIRNPNPENGEAYFALENNIVISAQQYLNGIWQEIPSAIYLGGSFHNLLGYDLTTLVYFGGNASSGSNFDVDLSTTNGLLRDIVNFLDDNFGYYSIGDDELELAESSFGDTTNRALKPSWFDLLLPLIYLIFVLVFLLEFFNSVIAFIAFLVRMITIQASPSGIQEHFVLAFQWLRGETEEPFYLLSNGSLNLTCWDFMVILFELFFIGLVFAVIRKNIDKLSIPSFRK